MEASRDFLSGSPEAATILQLFSKQIRIFKNILAQISAEKHVFLNV